MKQEAENLRLYVSLTKLIKPEGENVVAHFFLKKRTFSLKNPIKLPWKFKANECMARKYLCRHRRLKRKSGSFIESTCL